MALQPLVQPKRSYIVGYILCPHDALSQNMISYSKLSMSSHWCIVSVSHNPTNAVGSHWRIVSFHTIRQIPLVLIGALFQFHTIRQIPLGRP